MYCSNIAHLIEFNQKLNQKNCIEIKFQKKRIYGVCTFFINTTLPSDKEKYSSIEIASKSSYIQYRLYFISTSKQFEQAG